MNKQRFKYLDIITFKKIASLFAGNYKTSFQGSGMEFDDLRLYEHGDDVKTIDWLNSAKHDKVFIKKYHEEREMPSLFLFDLSGSMQFGLGNRKKIDTALEAFTLLGLSSLKNGDSISSIFYNDETFEHLEGKRGQLNLWKTIKRIEQHKQNNSIAVSDLSKALKFLFAKRLKNHFVFIFTDETKINEDVYFRALCKANDVIFLNIYDTFLESLEGKGSMSFCQKNESRFLDFWRKEEKQEYLNERNDSISELKKKVLAVGGSFVRLGNDSNVFKELYQFFKLRQKK